MHSTSITVTGTTTALPLARVTVTSRHPEVAEQCRRYFEGRWNVDPAATDAGHAPVISASVDLCEVFTIQQAVLDREHDEVRYSGARTLRLSDVDGRGYAVQLDGCTAYHAEPDRRRLDVFGVHPGGLSLATVRLARDVIRAQLQAAGWALLRGAAVVRDGRALLLAGAPGAGTTTAALHLCRAGWELISDGQVFARADDDGLVHLLPWPSPIAAGLPLLDAVGLYDRARQDHIDVAEPHPSQPFDVNIALRKGHRGLLVDRQGVVQQAMVFPAQLGLTPAADGTVAAVLLPHMPSGSAEPATDPDDADVVLGDGLITGSSPDRYPDLLKLTSADPSQANALRAVRAALAPFPRGSVRLEHHDPRETARVLAETADALVLGHSVAAGPAR
ncbi:hypothetical protein ACFU99_03895 [Streptomyces sp. NPDC057654]|uniref:hypothetical protein n=1 Tax=Streptomyces sp. NPDC057654 TaxID=3346196 RepID=UPI003683F0ED